MASGSKEELSEEELFSRAFSPVASLQSSEQGVMTPYLQMWKLKARDERGLLVAVSR